MVKVLCIPELGHWETGVSAAALWARRRLTAAQRKHIWADVGYAADHGGRFDSFPVHPPTIQEDQMDELYEMLQATKQRDSSNFNDALLVVTKFRDLLLTDDLDTMADKVGNLFTNEQLGLLAFNFHIVKDTTRDVEEVLQLILFRQMIAKNLPSNSNLN